VAVIGYPSKVAGEQNIAAFVVPMRSSSSARREVREFATESLPKSHIPRLILEIPEVPRTGDGFPRLGVLRELLPAL
jgi:acyl-coenzyme A synthetase/AMP-(fatty) acid ligase